MNAEHLPSQWAAWLDNMREKQIEDSPGITERSLRNYRSTVSTVLRILDTNGLPTDPKKIGPKELNALYGILLRKNIAVATGKSYEYALKLYTRTAGNHSIRDKKLPWANDTHPNAKWLTKALSRKIIKADLNTEQRMLIHLELCMGLRRIDSIRLEVSFIDWDGGKLHVLGKGHGNGKKRIVDFNESDNPLMNTRLIFKQYMDYRESVVKTIQAINRSAKDPKRLLIYTNGEDLGSFSEDGVAIDNRMKEISELTGVNFSNHMLRRTFGRTLYHNDVKIEDIAAIMGHDDPKMTYRYLGLGQIDHKDHMSMLDFGDDDEDDEN